MPTGTNLTYVAAAGCGHYPLPRPTDTGYRQAHAPQEAKRTGLDWSKHTAPADTKPVRCRSCRRLSDQLDDDQRCPDCTKVATQPPAAQPATSDEVAKHETPEPPTEGKQGKPTTGNSAPGATSASSTTGRAPVAGPSTHREKDPAAASETRPTAAAGPRPDIRMNQIHADVTPGHVDVIAPRTWAHVIAACRTLADAFTDLAEALDDVATTPLDPVAASAPQEPGDAPEVEHRPDAATGPTPPAQPRRVMGDSTDQPPTPRAPRQGTFPLAKAKQLYTQGMTCPQIAREIGSSPTYVRTKLKEAGVQMRDDRAGNGGSGKRRPDQDDPELVARFRELYLEQEHTIAQAADAVGLGYKAACNLMTRHNIPARPAANVAGQPPRWAKITDTQATEIAERYTAGESTLALGKAYGVSNNSIGNVLDRLGVPRRTASQARQLALAGHRIDGASLVAQQLTDLGVTAAAVKTWALDQGLIDAIKTGVPARHLVDAYKSAHPTATQNGATTA